jgi:cold-inducible RNA-binding protein
MAKKLYVGNLAFSVTDDGLQKLFAEVGTVESAKVITEKKSGRSKGFGFVEMATEEDAQKAISSLNGHEHEGRQLSVAEAHPQAPRDEGGGGGGPRRSGGGGRDRDRGYGGGGGGGGGGDRRRSNRW